MKTDVTSKKSRTQSLVNVGYFHSRGKCPKWYAANLYYVSLISYVETDLVYISNVIYFTVISAFMYVSLVSMVTVNAHSAVTFSKDASSLSLLSQLLKQPGPLMTLDGSDVLHVVEQFL
jgi:hypothetical protein